MCLIAEFGILIFGIVTLVKGQFTLSANRVVTGAPARVIGLIMVAMLPLIFCAGFAIGMILAMNLGRPPEAEDLAPLAALDVVAVLLTVGICCTIAFIYGKPKDDSATVAPPPSSFAPPIQNAPPRPDDGSNPYSSPSDHQ